MNACLRTFKVYHKLSEDGPANSILANYIHRCVLLNKMSYLAHCKRCAILTSTVKKQKKLQQLEYTIQHTNFETSVAIIGE